MAIDPSKYVVLDVETNGLSSARDDLLSVSFFMPDKQISYNRFLPLELNDEIKTTEFNGITENDLINSEPLSQDEIDAWIAQLELSTRTILTYGDLDRRFIKKYFQRHKLIGYEGFRFYNFKHDIISSRFSEGNITKDNLCRLFSIPNVKDVHTGQNDCILEWNLFKALNGRKLLITDNKVFFIEDDYYIPASYLQCYPNFKYFASDLPSFSIKTTVLKEFTIHVDSLKKHPTNFDGMLIEHLINSMLAHKRVDSSFALLENKKKCIYLGELPSAIKTLYVSFNPNGTITAVEEKDREIEKELNHFLGEIRDKLGPMVRFIREELFQNETILSQELVLHDDYRVMAMCDLSSENAVLEIKTNDYEPVKYKEQLFYESNGRRCYLLQTEWLLIERQLRFIISEIEFPNAERKQSGLYKELRAKYFLEKVPNKNIEIVEYTTRSQPITVRCKKCSYQWTATSYYLMNDAHCPKCELPITKETSRKQSSKPHKTKEEKQLEKEINFKQKVLALSNNTIVTYGYQGSNKAVNAVCLNCKREWTIRADHLLERPWCSKCRKRER